MQRPFIVEFVITGNPDELRQRDLGIGGKIDADGIHLDILLKFRLDLGLIDHTEPGALTHPEQGSEAKTECYIIAVNGDFTIAIGGRGLELHFEVGIHHLRASAQRKPAVHPVGNEGVKRYGEQGYLRIQVAAGPVIIVIQHRPGDGNQVGA